MGIFFYREKNRNRLLQLVTELGPLKKKRKNAHIRTDCVNGFRDSLTKKLAKKGRRMLA
jgi:hypothetical protein